MAECLACNNQKKKLNKKHNTKDNGNKKKVLNILIIEVVKEKVNAQSKMIFNIFKFFPKKKKWSKLKKKWKSDEISAQQEKEMAY